MLQRPCMARVVTNFGSFLFPVNSCLLNVSHQLLWVRRTTKYTELTSIGVLQTNGRISHYRLLLGLTFVSFGFIIHVFFLYETGLRMRMMLIRESMVEYL